MATARNAPGYRGALVFLILAVVGYLLLSAVFLVLAPDRVPSHFDATGRTDDWATKTSLVATLIPIGVGLPVLIGLPWPWAKRPVLLNVPYKRDWIDSGRSRGLTDRVIVFMRLIGGLMCVLLGVILAVMLVDARSSAPAEAMPG